MPQKVQHDGHCMTETC